MVRVSTRTVRPIVRMSWMRRTADALACEITAAVQRRLYLPESYQSRCRRRQAAVKAALS